jgi:hypothetical protein
MTSRNALYKMSIEAWSAKRDGLVALVEDPTRDRDDARCATRRRVRRALRVFVSGLTKRIVGWVWSAIVSLTSAWQSAFGVPDLANCEDHPRSPEEVARCTAFTGAVVGWQSRIRTLRCSTFRSKCVRMND